MQLLPVFSRSVVHTFFFGSRTLLTSCLKGKTTTLIFDVLPGDDTHSPRLYQNEPCAGSGSTARPPAGRSVNKTSCQTSIFVPLLRTGWTLQQIVAEEHRILEVLNCKLDTSLFAPSLCTCFCRNVRSGQCLYRDSRRRHVGHWRFLWRILSLCRTGRRP